MKGVNDDCSLKDYLMKKNILKVALVATFAFFAGYGVYIKHSL
ncbi:hypothetical protein [uncultured Bacteroides sp.]|nr:hypothetical protein [uncultured Bacteroides sp.]